MGRSKHLLHLALSASVCSLVASLACAQQAPDTTTPTTPEAAAAGTPAVDDYQMSTTETLPPPPPSTFSTMGMPHPGEPMVDEDTRLTFPNRPLIITGSTLLVLSYAPAVIWQASQDRNDDLYIPVAGPWMDFAGGEDGNLAMVLLAADGALQGLGALMTVGSLFIPERRTRRWNLLGTGMTTFNLAPSRIAREGYGLFAQGAF